MEMMMMMMMIKIIIIIGEIGTISISLRIYCSNVPGKKEIKELQTTATLGIAHILRKVLMSKYKLFNMGSNITCTINCNYRVATTLYALETYLFMVYD
jgi:hypothetical protein